MHFAMRFAMHFATTLQSRTLLRWLRAQQPCPLQLRARSAVAASEGALRAAAW
jgi:hypothetical protein